MGYERIQEIEDPELATKRTRALYAAKGYSADWIEKRIRSIAIRDELTDEWKQRGVREQREYPRASRLRAISVVDASPSMEKISSRSRRIGFAQRHQDSKEVISRYVRQITRLHRVAAQRPLPVHL